MAKTRVVIKRHGNGIVAYIPGKVEVVDVRPTEHEALGFLVMYHPEHFNCEIEVPVESAVTPAYDGDVESGSIFGPEGRGGGA